MAFRRNAGFFKPALLTMAVLTGLSATLFTQQVRGQGQQTMTTNGDGPPEVPLSQARAMVSFPLYLPSDFPKGISVRRAHVTHIHVINPQTPEEWTKAHSEPMHGFGVLFFSKGGKITTRSFRGSPAEAAGLPPSEVELVSWDGVAAADAYAHFGQFAHREPMALTIKNENGEERTVTVPHPTDYTFRPDPLPIIPQDNYVIIYMDKGDKAMSLIEGLPSLRSCLPGYPTANAGTTDVAGKQVTFFGPAAAPSAYWTDTKAGVYFWAENHTGAVSRSDLIQMIAKMERVP